MTEVQNSQGKKVVFQQTEEFLQNLKDQLTEAEVHIGENDFEHGITIYMTLAESYLDDYREYHVAAYLFKKCIQLAELKEDPNKEALAEMGFAKCHDLFDRSDDAIHNLEKAISKATDFDTIGKVSEELISIYKKLAEKYEHEAKGYDDNIQRSLDYYEKCIVVCRKSEQKHLEGKISNKIGKIYFKYKIFDKSIENQKSYLRICEEQENVVTSSPNTNYRPIV